MGHERPCHLGQVSLIVKENIQELLIDYLTSAVPSSTLPRMTMKEKDKETESYHLEKSRTITQLLSLDARPWLGTERPIGLLATYDGVERVNQF